MSVGINFEFPSLYEAKLLSELPANMPRFYFPGANSEGGKDGLVVRISTKNSSEWIGVFAFGYPSPKVKNGLYSCPDEQVLCVVSQGRGYLVRADEPSAWEQVRAYPITYMQSVILHNLIIFADFTRLTAYGKDGLSWQTDELSWDGIKISAVFGDFIHGFGWDAPTGKYVAFTVDMRTGHHDGGASPTNS
jgi:hypothetical protein